MTWTLVLGVGPPSAGRASDDTPTASLQPSAEAVRFGTQVVFQGALSDVAACLEGRTVELQGMSEGELVWTTLATAASSPDGAYEFRLHPEHTRRYRAIVPEEARSGATCAQAMSAETMVEVQVRVDATLPRRAFPAGACPRVHVLVSPGKPGTEIRLQQAFAGGWRDVGAGTLDAGSAAHPEICVGWSAIGRTRLRALWPDGDELNAEGTSPPLRVTITKAGWMKRIDRVAAGRAVGVSVREAGLFLYRRTDRTARVPASNEKLFLSMALLESLGPEARIQTVAAGHAVDGVVQGTLWILGRGDPRGGPGTMGRLAAAIVDAGVRRVEGDVRGSTGYFARDWSAPGWKPDAPGRDVALPTALTYRGNRSSQPERDAAAALADRLEARGVQVTGSAGSGAAPAGIPEIASVTSASLETLLGFQNRTSSNFYAEVLGKGLGVEHEGAPGTIGKGAAAIEAWARAQGVRLTANDASGLSYANRVSPVAIARLLGIAEGLAWGDAFRATLARGNQGTLTGRLAGISVRAKTGTLSEISALSGYVWLERRDVWAEFSILSSGMSKATAAALEDVIVTTLANRGG